MNEQDLAVLEMELSRASNIRPKPKINPGPTKSKLVEGNLGFNEGFNSAQYYANQSGKPISQDMGAGRGAQKL